MYNVHTHTHKDTLIAEANNNNKCCECVCVLFACLRFVCSLIEKIIISNEKRELICNANVERKLLKSADACGIAKSYWLFGNDRAYFKHSLQNVHTTKKNRLHGISYAYTNNRMNVPTFCCCCCCCSRGFLLLNASALNVESKSRENIENEIEMPRKEVSLELHIIDIGWCSAYKHTYIPSMQPAVW